MSLSTQSINKMIRMLKSEYITHFREKCVEYEAELAHRGEQAARSTFGSGSLHYEVYRAKGGTRLRVSGEQVMFLEFGAGFLTDEGHPFAEAAPVKVEAGAYSKKHAKTYQKYVKAHSDDDPSGINYPYNRHPKRGMLAADMAMRDQYYDVARKVFGK